MSTGTSRCFSSLGGSESAAVFLTERHDGDRIVKAAIKLIPAAPENSELQLSRWRMAAELSHPHLLRLFETGSCELGGIPLLYVVMECAEENLAQVLSQRALTPAETRAMLGPLLEVLGYVHAKGLVHGHIRPANIMAIGDELKLSSDGLLQAGESDGSSAIGDKSNVAHASLYDPPESAPGFVPPAKGASPAGDVWSLGMTLVEVLTRNLPSRDAAGQGNDLPLPADLPEPFLDIVRHTLVQNPEDRWTVTQIAARLEDRAPASQVSAPVPEVRTPPRVAQPASRPQAAPAKRTHTLTVTVFPSPWAFCFWPQFCSRQSYSGALPKSPRLRWPCSRRQPLNQRRRKSRCPFRRKTMQHCGRRQTLRGPAK